MLLNYLTLSLRLMVRNPFFTIINIFGLSVGVTIFYVLWQYSQFELKSDQFHADYNRIVRPAFVRRIGSEEGQREQTLGVQHAEVARQMAIDFDEIDTLTRIINQENFRFGVIPFHTTEILISTLTDAHEKVGFRETKVAYGDPNLFTFFSLPLIRGEAGTVLSKPHSIVVSERLVQKYFGQQDPIGKVLTVNDSLDLIVTGVFKEIPHNSHLDFQMVISSLTLGNSMFDMSPRNIGVSAYFKLREGTDLASLEKKFNESYPRYWGALMRQMGGNLDGISPFLQPLSEIPFSVYHADYFTPKSRITLLVFASVGLVVLVMAWINYLNLTISFNRRRMKEFAARRTLGAKSSDLAAQFLTESFLVNLLAVSFAFTLFQLLRQPLQVWLGFYLPSWSETSTQTIGIIAVCVATGILLTGIYPSLITHIKAPKSITRVNAAGQKDSTGRWLTVSQYVGAITLIVWTFIIVLQLHFMLSKDLGLDIENVLVVDLPLDTDHTSSSLTGFKNSLAQNKNVIDYAVSRSVAGDDPVIDVWIKGRGAKSIEGGGYTNGGVDERFLPFYNIKLLAGRNFTAESPGEENNIIVDMNAIAFMDLKQPQEAIGREVELQDAWPNNLWYTVKIIGVVETFSLRPLSQRLILNGADQEANVLTYKHLRKADLPKKVSIRLEAIANQNLVGAIGDSFHQSFSGELFNAYFLDENITRHYNRDKFARNQIIFITGIAILVACLGLFGMMVNQVTSMIKELGIRKVLGAELHQLGGLLLKSTAGHLLISTSVSLPISYFLVREHLSNFIQRIELQWWHFASPIAILVLIMLATVSSVVWNAAKSNPVEALKHE